MIQYRRGHWSTNEGLGCGDVCISAIYSNDAVSWRRLVDQLEGVLLDMVDQVTLNVQEDQIEIQSGLQAC